MKTGAPGAFVDHLTGGGAAELFAKARGFWLNPAREAAFRIATELADQIMSMETRQWCDFLRQRAACR